MSAVYVITRMPEGEENLLSPQKLLCALLEEDRLTEVFVDQKGQSLLGNIYIGKVKNILRNIDAAFVEIAGGQLCFLPFSEARHPVLTNRAYDGRLLVGDEILVQVQKDAVKTKDPVLTARLSLPGKYVSLSLGEENGIRFSHRLSAKEQSVFSDTLKESALPSGITAIVRTQARELIPTDNFSPLTRELDLLLDQASRLLRTGQTRTVFSLLTESIPGYLKRLQSLSPFPDRIVTDELSVFQTLQSYCRENMPECCSSLDFYQDSSLSLYGLYGLGTRLKDALSKNVWLRSGGYLVIEPTEALTVIDVNTGKCDVKKSVGETFYKINEEAAQEVARQLRLRNLSGIILVDFINMSGAEDKRKLLAFLRTACQNDPVPVTVVDMTPLGLVEITRKKVSRPLAEQLGCFSLIQKRSTV